VEAFEALVKRQQQAVYAFCRRLTGAHQSADDLAQETFVRAYFALGRFDAGRPLYPWLRRIALNAGLNLIKARRRERPLADEAPPRRASDPPARDQPLERLEQTEFEDRFRRAVALLPVEQRSVFVLRFDEALSYDEIARALDLPLGTVMSRLNRARRALRAQLADLVARRA
jgi:RNA polymerase sigma-70 factor (ECF subfamily)